MEKKTNWEQRQAEQIAEAKRAILRRMGYRKVRNDWEFLRGVQTAAEMVSEAYNHVAIKEAAQAILDDIEEQTHS